MKRTLLTAVAAILLALAPARAHCQTLSFQGGGTTRTVAAANDFATIAIGDAWDFSQISDHVFMFSSGWIGGPSVTGGRLTGTAGASPIVQIQFEGVNGALNLVGRNGVRYPIDPAAYDRISYKMSWSATPPANDMVEVRWFQGTTRDQSTIGGRLGLSYGYDGTVGRYVNQSTVSSQSVAGYHIFKRDLAAADAGGGRAYWSTWTQYGVVRGLALGLSNNNVSGVTYDIDWVRLTKRGAAAVGLSWSGFGGAVTLTAANAATGDTVQIFPDNGTSSTTFSDNQSFTWDHGFLPAGIWTITATRGGTSRQITLTIKETPTVQLTEPDASGGRDFATTVGGDPWDLSSVQDVTRFYGWLLNMAGETFGASGLHAVSVGLDPGLYLMDDSSRPPGTTQTIDAAVYRNLTFTVEYDNKAYRWDGSNGFQILLGGVARVIWRQADKNGAPLTNTQDIIVTDGGPHTFSMDLATFTSFGGDTCATCTLEIGHGTDLWQGRIALFRLDPLEPAQTQGFRIANVKVAADDEPDSRGHFVIRWTANDPAAAVTLYYDTDTNPSSGRTMIASGLSASAGQYDWYLAGVPVGRYWVHAEIRDSLGVTQSRYSAGALAVRTAVADSDTDGLPDTWEVQFGLDPRSAGGVDGASGDPDADGRTNLQEYQDGTHPRGTFTRYFAEGATGSLFDCQVALLNPDVAQPATVLLRFLRDDGVTVPTVVMVPPQARRTVTAESLTGLASASFATVVEADRLVVADRTMTWDGSGYGSHAEGSVAAPATRWYLAEGATHWNFDLYYLLQNPSLTLDAQVEITYLRPAPLAPVVRRYTVPRASRKTIWVDGEGAELAATDVSASIVVTNSVPIIVERAMYLSTPGQFFGAGHASAAVTAPALEWFLAEGATGSYFNLYYLLANPNATNAAVTVTYMPEGAAAFTKSYTVRANSRQTIFVNGEDARVANASVSARVTVTNNVPVIVERAMWWPGPTPATWMEAHNSPGLVGTGVEWALADGEVGGPRAMDTYVLIANPAAAAGLATVTLLFEDGSAPATQTFSLPPNSRTTVYPPWHFPGMFPAGTWKKFGVVVTSSGGPIVVERAMYGDAGGVHWAAGTNAAATRLR